MKFISFMSQGGFMMMPLFLCSVISATIIIERFINLRSSKIFPESLCRPIDEQKEIDEIVKQEKLSGVSPLGNMIRALSKQSSRPEEVQLRIYHVTIKKEIHFLERGLEALAVIATVTPLLGLLGTVLGMVDVFGVIVKEGVGQAGAFSGGIAKALLTTIAGLSIAIPTLIFHGFFSRKVESLISHLEDYSHSLLIRIRPAYANEYISS